MVQHRHVPIMGFHDVLQSSRSVYHGDFEILSVDLIDTVFSLFCICLYSNSALFSKIIHLNQILACFLFSEVCFDR